MAIGEPPRPYWPKLGLVVDGGSGCALGFKLEGPDKTMVQTAAECLVEGLKAVQARPETVALSSVDLLRALTPLLQSLKTRVLPVNYSRRGVGGVEELRVTEDCDPQRERFYRTLRRAQEVEPF